MSNKLQDSLGYIKKLLVKKIVVIEQIKDPEIVQMRKMICGPCPNNIDGTCKICKCIIELKVKSKTNRTKKFGTEITHCPEGFWGDSQTANYYKQQRT